VKAKVYIKFPKTGLGNMMLVWARGIVFAQLNDLPVVASSWWGLHWGALLRREKKSRLYLGYFKESSLLKQLLIKFFLKLKTVELDPIIVTLRNEKKNEPKLYVFNKVVTDNDLFGSLREHEEIIKARIEKALTSKMKLRLAMYKEPIIGVHIRRGDFKLGNQTTPLNYFIESINTIRNTIDKNLPVTIFSDADELELKEILAISNVKLTESKPDILDILLLSKSKFIVLSRSSTFGYWAAFLSNAFVIRPFDDWQLLIKNNSSTYKEIKFNIEDANSKKTLVDILKEVDS
jgi:Glycosyl transferase family 11